MRYYGTMKILVPRQTQPAPDSFGVSLEHDDQRNLEGMLLGSNRTNSHPLQGKQVLCDGRVSFLLGVVDEDEQSRPYSLFAMQGYQNDQDDLSGYYQGFYIPKEHQLIGSLRDLYQGIMTSSQQNEQDWFFRGLYHHINGPRRNQPEIISEPGVVFTLSRTH